MSEAMPGELGPLRILERIGRGGMGEVWRAVHATEGAPLAVKVLVSRDPWYVERFRREVRAVAALDHPHVVRIVDAGTLPASAGGLGGCPWLAMELAPRGSVATMPPSWPVVRAVAAAVLDGLAHAHARGLLHRDVKPANLLRMGEAGARIVLSDFGLAGAADDLDRVAGTPGFMAPELRRGRWRELGPWTDLYAVGRTVWALIAGTPDGANARFALPVGFEGWLERLVDPIPAARFPFAADAAFALAALADPEPNRAVSPVAPGGWSGPTLADLCDPESELERASSPLPAVGRTLLPLPRPLPRDPVPRPRLLAGVGRGISALRLPPLVGREAEVAALWERVRRVRALDRSVAVVLTGPSGVGKTALGAFVATRAHEVGAAHVVTRADEALEPRDRAVIAWLDDRPDALRDARRLLDTTVGVLILCSASDEDLAQTPALAEALDALLVARATALPVPSLPASAIRELVLERLGPSALGATIEARAAGNPGFAVEVVAQLAESDRLIRGPEGWDLVGELPVALSASRLARLERIGPGPALELAAALGIEVERDEWLQVAAAAGVPAADHDWGALADAGLARPTADGYRFGSSWVREALVQRAGVALAGYHDAAARVLAAQDPPPAERLGRHLAGAGRADEAVDWLGTAGADATIDGDPERALELLDAALDALRAAETPAEDERWGRVRLARVTALAYSRAEVAAAECERLLEEAMARDWPFAARTARAAARLARMTGDLDRALARCDTARELDPDPLARAGVEVERAYALQQAGRISEATATFRATAAFYLAAAQPVSRALTLIRLAHGLRMAGDLAAADDAYREALAMVDAGEVADDWRGDPLNGLAETARLRGDSEHARALYEEALAVFVRDHSSDQYGVVLNLALLDLQTGGTRARELVATHLPAMARSGKVELMLVAKGIQVAAAAAAGDFSAFDQHLEEWTERLDRTAIRNDDVPALAAAAAHSAERAGHPTRAVRCLKIAVEAWSALGRHAERAAAETALRSLEGAIAGPRA